ncbi:tetratricopeptide repeat protein [Niveispirillum sp. KHB5.9]|uniref:tetratricopeptide repeat protein n=1 Tax=Niveispirillum sp. KHB5.9 TaxID=3400269 RepID=UPI003A852B1F
MDVNTTIDRAVALHQGGDLVGAEALYRDILVAVPGLADVHYLLGMALLGQGKAPVAVKALRMALRLKPGAGEWWFNLGTALRQAGEGEAALDAFATAADRYAGEPARRADALAESGALLAARGDGAGAERMLREALSLAPGHAGSRGNLSAVLYNRFADADSLDRTDAAAGLAEAARLTPDRVAIWHRLGLAHLRAERPAAALEAFDTALARGGGGGALLLARSDALSVLGRFEEAHEMAERAAAILPPDETGPLVAGAVALHGLGLLGEAADMLRRVLAIDPGHVAGLLNLGNVLEDQGDGDGAEECYRRLLARAPNLPVAHWQRAQARLRAGDLAEGWREYEWRWHMPGFGLPAPLRGLPVWDGVADPPGGCLLVHAEQGHGDSLQFIRYVPMLRARGLDLHVQVQSALVRLFRDSLPDDIAVGTLGDAVPDGIACRCPLLGLPLRLGTGSLTDIPADIPYLRVPEVRRMPWRARLRDLPGLRVGLVWAGDGRAGDPRAAATDRRRSLSLPQLAPLRDIPGISWVSLQKGPKAAQAADAPFAIADWTEELSDFADTAALVAELDLVVGVDTAVIHLSAALGRPTWVLSRFDGCWRWLRDRGDNPWYRELRLFRQAVWGDWRPAITELADGLARHTSESASEVKGRNPK